MFDISEPALVFDTQTLHPILEYHTGYIFKYYEFHFHKPREMFFTHIYEAQVFALYRGAKLELNPDLKPGIVTAQEYTLSGQDESQFLAMPDLRSFRGSAAKVKLPEVPTDQQLVEMDELMTGEVPAIDWFGED